MKGQNFSVEDKLDSDTFNRAVWKGLKGEELPYPEVRHGQDLREGRDVLLKAYSEQINRECETGINTASAE